MTNRRVKYAALCAAVLASHVLEGMEGGHHPFDHSLRVAEMGVRILPDGTADEVADIVFMAGMCHGADRVVEEMLGPDAAGEVQSDEGLTRSTIEGWLRAMPDLDAAKRAEVVEVVMNHRGKNKPDEPLTHVALRDADKLVNVAPDIVVRASKFPIPAVDCVHFLEAPDATYSKPGCVCRDLWYMATRWDFEHALYDPNYGIVLPKAREIGRRYFPFLRAYVEAVIGDRHAMDLAPYPQF